MEFIEITLLSLADITKPRI